MLTPAQAVELKKLIRRLVRAEIAHSWKGSAPPSDVEIIEDDLRSETARVASFISRHTYPRKPGTDSAA